MIMCVPAARDAASCDVFLIFSSSHLMSFRIEIYL